MNLTLAKSLPDKIASDGRHGCAPLALGLAAFGLGGCEPIGQNTASVPVPVVSHIYAAPDRPSSVGVIAGGPGGVDVIYYTDVTQINRQVLGTPAPVLATQRADIDRDGDEDIVVILTNEVGVLRQSGGAFIAYAPLRTALCPSDFGRTIKCADIDGANGPDLLTGCSAGGGSNLRVQCWLNDGDGDFTAPPVEFTCPNTAPSSCFELQLANLDAAAGPEIVMTASNRLYVLRYDGATNAIRAVAKADGSDFAGTASEFVAKCGYSFPSPTGPLTGVWLDCTGDGIDDGYCVTFFGGVGFVPGLGDRRLGPVQPFAVPAGSGQPGNIAVGLLNEDTIPDVVLTCEGTDRMVVYPGAGGGALLAPRTVHVGDAPVGAVILPTGPTGTAFERPSIALGQRDEDAVALFCTDGAGGFFGLQRVDLSGFGIPARVVVSDLNGDGFGDAVAQLGSLVYRPNVADGSGLVSETGLSYGSLTSSNTRGLCAVPPGAAAGAARVATLLTTNNLLVVAGLVNPTTLSATDTAPASGFPNGRALGSGDFSGDGEPDIALFNGSADNTQADLGLFVFQSAADEYGPSTAINLPTVQRISAACGPLHSGVAGGFRAGVLYDGGSGLDRVGIIDLVPGPGNTVIATETANLTLPTAGVAIAGGDLNGDTYLDLLVLNSGSGTVTALLSGGAASFEAPDVIALPLGVSATALAVGPINADDAPDIAVTVLGPSNRNGRMLVMLNDGSGGFDGTVTQHLSGGAPGSIVLHDLHNPTPSRGAAARLSGPEAIMGCTAFLPSAPGLVIVPNVADPSAPPPPACMADFNADGTVSTPDLTFFLGRFGQSSSPGSDAARADFNGDGIVSTPDLVFFLGRFGQPCP